MTDMTVNRSGPSNMPPTPPPWRDGVTDLIDGFIKDKWIAPENRELEIAWVYSGQLKAAYRDLASLRRHLDRASYADGWVDRILDYMETSHDPSQ